MVPAVISVGLILGGALLCLLLVRCGKGSRYLAVVVLGSYSLRVALAVGLYLVSAYELSIFRSLQFKEGFWRFTYDAPFYHENGVRIAETLRAGQGLPLIMFGDRPFLVDSYEFFYFVGMVYRVFGAHPLWVPLLNAVLWGVVAVLCYALARRIRGEGAGRVAATLVSCWPSALLWSSQILKDNLMIFLLMVSFYLIARIWEERSWVAFPAGALLVPAVFLLARIREYTVAFLILAVVASLGLTVLFRFHELRWRGAVRALAIIALLWMPFLVARYLDSQWLILLSTGSTDSVQLFSKARDYLVAPEASGQVGPVEVSASEKARFEPAGAGEPLAFSQQVVQLVTRGSVDLAFETYDPRKIDSRRATFAKLSGASSFGGTVRFRSFWDRVAFLPRGLAYALYAPFPWQWFSATGDTGRFKTFSGVETILMAAMTPLLLLGVLRAAGSRRADAWALLFFGVITLIVVALTVTNLGTLFRVRLQALIPLLVLVSAYGDPPARVRALWHRLRSRRSVR